MTRTILFAITIANAAMFVATLARPHTTSAQSATPVLRAKAFELVDDQGKVRAELKVMPADSTIKMPDGTSGYPETVLLRLITSKGGPNVKLAAAEDGAGLVLGSDSGYAQVLSRGKNDPFVKLVNKDGREQTIALTRKP